MFIGKPNGLAWKIKHGLVALSYRGHDFSIMPCIVIKFLFWLGDQSKQIRPTLSSVYSDYWLALSSQSLKKAFSTLPILD